MTPETSAVIAATISTLGTIVVAYLANGARTAARRAGAQAKSAHEQASVAADNSKPVSNGFTAHVRENLAEILTVATEARSEATQARELGEANRDTMTRHLEAHANVHMAAPVYPRVVQQ